MHFVRKILLCVLLHNFWPLAMEAQVFSDTVNLNPEPKIAKSVKYDSPSVVGGRRSKALTIGLMLLPAFDIRSVSRIEALEDANIQVKNLEVVGIKLKIPIILKPRTKLIFGFGYRYEEYNLREEQPQPAVFANLKDKKLNSLDFNLFLSRAIAPNRFLIMRGGVQFNGDYGQNKFPIARYTKYIFSGIYGWKKNKYTFNGVGLYFNYNLGSPSLYPAFVWNKTFNEKWGIESILPAKINLRYNFSEQSILVASTEIEGSSYHIVLNDPPLSAFQALELRRADILNAITFEQEIYDFLWFSMSVGYRHNVNFDVSEDNKIGSATIIDNQVGGGPFAQISLFVVPPGKLTTKILKEVGD